MVNSGAHDVIIIGGGLAGTAAAWFLAREGVDVLLLERGELNARATGANAGSIHLQIPTYLKQIVFIVIFVFLFGIILDSLSIDPMHYQYHLKEY